MTETTGFASAPRAQKSTRSWSLFQPAGSGSPPDFAGLPPRRYDWSLPLAAPIIIRIKRLQAIALAPETYARRMAFHLARQREDREAILPWTEVNLRRLGLELSALYPFLAISVMEAIYARPPRAGPKPYPPPRIRML